VITVLAPGLTPAGTAAFEANTFPAAASSYVGAHFPGARMYSTYEWGGYLTSRFPESRMVYIYGESAVFGDARLQQYLDIHLLRHDWQRHLSAAGMTHAVVPEESQEASALHELSWRVDCHDVRSRSLVMSAPSGNIPAAPPAAAAPLEYGSSPRC
jgi:hypothetical protein